jgi:hypothetical protein
VTFGVLSVLALLPAFAAFTAEEGTTSTIAMLVLVLLSVVLSLFAPTIRRALGRGFLILGASVFVLPISTFLLSGRVASEVVSTADAGDEAIAAVGAGLAGVAATGLATFFGLILGAILFLIGIVLVLGGRREVIVVQDGVGK